MGRGRKPSTICPRCKLRPRPLKLVKGLLLKDPYCQVCKNAYQAAYRLAHGYTPRAVKPPLPKGTSPLPTRRGEAVGPPMPRTFCLDTDVPSALPVAWGWGVDRRYASMTAGLEPDPYFSLCYRPSRQPWSDVRSLRP